MDKHPNTVKRYATDIRDYIGPYEHRGIDIGQVKADHLSLTIQKLLLDVNGRNGSNSLIESKAG